MYNSYSYCGCYTIERGQRKYLPQVNVSAHTTVYSSTSRTVLTQHFTNPYDDKPLEELRYVFPLYDGVSVVGFTCTVGSRLIKGVVKERQKAKQVYKEATERGETAGLFEQSLDASDVFSTTIGNVPAGGNIKAEITYIGELKHDAETDGLRFTLPTVVSPRYGWRSHVEDNSVSSGSISITVDAEMPAPCAIKSIQSPSHPIAVNMGTTTTSRRDEQPTTQKASASLSLDTAALDKDFIIQIGVSNLGEPLAVLETHPTIPGQRALVTTLVPKFRLPAEKPEIVFVCDRSGSMFNKMTNLVSALEIFLKSLPVGVKFNICSFGSRCDFLWPKSQSYSQESLDQAIKHVKPFSANYGGTEMYSPLKDTFRHRYKDMNLEVFLLTDGEIWDQDRLFGLVRDEVSESKGAVRVFTLGVGSDVSSALVEGVARAGNGFAQFVSDNEKMDKKIVRMLKAALFPHIHDYTLEIMYKKPETTSEDEDFELVERVQSNLNIGSEPEDDPRDTTEEEASNKKPISLFDPDLKDDEEATDASSAVDTKYDHLPPVVTPRYLQAPFKMPPLFPFNRTTVYVMLSDSTPAQRPSYVRLKATSIHGPLELEIPIVDLPEKETTIHQLAAKKAVQELEEGRGWIYHAKNTGGKLLKDKYEGQFSDMVEREAVRLGVRYQISSKWCSFVAVQENPHGSSKEMKVDQHTSVGDDDDNDSSYAEAFGLKDNGPSPPPPAAPCRAPIMCRAPPSPSARIASFHRDDTRSTSPGFGFSAQNLSARAPSQFWSQMKSGDGLSMAASFGMRSRETSLDDAKDSVGLSDPLQALISLQMFDGSWVWSKDLEKILGVTDDKALGLGWPDALANNARRSDIVATALAVTFIKTKFTDDEETWEMIVDKAKDWLEDQTGMCMEDLEATAGFAF